MKINVDKNLDGDVFHTIKTAIGYPPKSASNKISYINFCKLTEITKKLIISGKLCLALIQNISHSELFLDISKAFDKVWHNRLIYKFKQNGVAGDLISYFD